MLSNSVDMAQLPANKGSNACYGFDFEEELLGALLIGLEWEIFVNSLCGLLTPALLACDLLPLARWFANGFNCTFGCSILG